MKKFKSQGFTLLEVMIALFVLAVGMLGSTTLILQGQKEATKTNSEGAAVQYALAMAERMRANLTGVEDGNYDAFTSGNTDPGCAAAVPGCSAQKMAEYDSFLWDQELGDLKNGTGTVTNTNPGVADSIFNITVSWDETVRTSETTGAVQTKSYVMIFQP